jgi:hypothetical protein
MCGKERPRRSSLADGKLLKKVNQKRCIKKHGDPWAASAG